MQRCILSNSTAYFIIPSALSVGVIESQVLAMALGVYGGRDLRFLVLGKNAEEKIEALRAVTTDVNFSGNIASLIRDRSNVEIVYFRSVTQFVKLFPILKVFSLAGKTVMDFRALVSEESYFRNKSLLRKTLLGALERLGLHLANSVRCVSHNLAAELSHRYRRTDISVVPCLVHQCEVREKKKYNGSQSVLKLIYVGGMADWQNFPEICRTVSELQKLATCSFTIVTGNPERARKVAMAENVKNYEVFSGNRNLVLEKLDLADFGFIFRNSSIINSTASPIKFVEYLSRGVLPITTGTIGDYSENEEIRGAFIRYEGDTEALARDLFAAFKYTKLLDQAYRASQKCTWQYFAITNPL